MPETELPNRGTIHWPVGEGDSTTIVIDDETVVQIDVHNLASADDGDDPRVAIIDRLVEILPVRNGKPYLAAFGLTHADEDHCLGFAELLERVTIGDLWFSPYILRDEENLSNDAEAFCAEARRRVDVNIAGPANSGDRIRVIGDHDLLREPTYAGLPEECLTPPGSAFSAIDGVEHGEVFRVFVHGPVGSEDEIERNDTSLAMQITLAEDGAEMRLLLLGDLAYPGVRSVFDTENKESLAWNVLLAPHHCSRSVFCFALGDEQEKTLKQDIVDDMREAAHDPGWVVASCGPIPASNQPGDDPPHADARSRYEEIAPTAVLVTGEHPNADAPEPIIFDLSAAAVELRNAQGTMQSPQSVKAAVAGARGADEPPKQTVGFGCRS
jgi:hypothetical protein